MKAIVFEKTGGPEVLQLADVPKPEVRPGMVLIKVHAIGVNFADTRFRQGTYVAKPKLPDTPGMEAAGVVEAVGDGVTDFRPGARVAAFTVKSYAEYCQAPASMVVPLPDFVGFVEGAALPIQVLTAYHMLHTADSTGPGRTVLVHSAAGGVGLARSAAGEGRRRARVRHRIQRRQGAARQGARRRCSHQLRHPEVR
jgi:NADPH2:quinone reductase